MSKGLTYTNLKPIYKKKYSDQKSEIKPDKDRKKKFESIRKLIEQKSKK